MVTTCKFTGFHIFGLIDFVDRCKVLLTYFDGKIYIEDCFGNKDCIYLKDITDVQMCEQPELKEKFMLAKSLCGYVLGGVFGAILGVLGGLHVKMHRYLYLQTISKEYVFEMKQDDIKTIIGFILKQY